MPEVNYLAVVVAAVASFLSGGLWYSNALFGKVWQRESGVTDAQLENGNMARIFGLSLVLSLIAAWVFALFLGPRPPAALGPWRRVLRRPVLGDGQLRHELSIRTPQLETIPHQRRLPHAAIHRHRSRARLPALRTHP